MKKDEIQSVVQDWVSALPFTQQAVLLVALRGPDGMPKETDAKPLIHYLRGTILHPAYPGYEQFAEGTIDGFMRGDYYDNFTGIRDKFLMDLEKYPLHFITHLMHAAEIVGYKYRDDKDDDIDYVGACWQSLYVMMCRRLHLQPETKEQLDARLKF